ncbi:MAG: hypothetical protein SFY95_12845 [Planctomycetota bacterium]|nr:hypothetical protein [Planctomycetota bacterium]
MKKLAVLVLMASAGVAMADKAPTSGQALSGHGAIGTAVDAFADRAVTNITLSGIPSFDPFGDANNFVGGVFIGANAQIVGIGWDVNLTANSPSWLSELTVAIENTSQSGGVFLAPGTGDDFGGTRTYSSGGIVDLVGLGLNFTLGGDGILRLEFFEGFDDFANGVDGFWNSGTLSIQWIPTPGALAILGLGGIAAGRRRR